MAENFIRLRRGLEVFSVGEQILDALGADDLNEVLVNDQLGAVLRDDYEVRCPELDAVMEIAEAIGEQGGVYGCRMTGGGFGGCCVALVKASEVGGISKKIVTEYKARTGIAATIFASRPAAGATVLKG